LELQDKKIRYVDLFCGLGAFHEAFKRRSSLECVFACDINDRVRKIYEVNHGLAPAGDIRSVNAHSLPDFDILCAGFPCQPFSIAGLRKGFGDDNGNLFYEVLRFADAKKPKMMILENVKNLRGHDGGRTYSTIKSMVEDRGYRFFSKVLDSSHYGSPQCRQRIFMVAVRDGDFCFPPRAKSHSSVLSILDRSDESHWDESGYYLVEKRSACRPFKPRILFDVHSKKTKKGGRQGERVYDASACGVTICASSGGPGAKTGLYKVGNKIRRLNSKECLAMFGFPASYDFLDATEEQKMFYLGNSIVVNVVDTMVPEILRIFGAGS
jgi:DNA (cytosine-5)-methyltransferase 1